MLLDGMRNMVNNWKLAEDTVAVTPTLNSVSCSFGRFWAAFWAKCFLENSLPILYRESHSRTLRCIKTSNVTSTVILMLWLLGVMRCYGTVHPKLSHYLLIQWLYFNFFVERGEDDYEQLFLVSFMFIPLFSIYEIKAGALSWLGSETVTVLCVLG